MKAHAPSLLMLFQEQACEEHMTGWEQDYIMMEWVEFAPCLLSSLAKPQKVVVMRTETHMQCSSERQSRAYRLCSAIWAPLASLEEVYMSWQKKSGEVIEDRGLWAIKIWGHWGTLTYACRDQLWRQRKCKQQTLTNHGEQESMDSQLIVLWVWWLSVFNSHDSVQWM